MEKSCNCNCSYLLNGGMPTYQYPQYPQIKANSGWNNYKNVKSGKYNRNVCWNCSDFKGFPQTPGVYPLNIVNGPCSLPSYSNNQKWADFMKIYQARRMQNSSPNIPNYENYLDAQGYFLYPKQYVKGNWSSEQLIYTNVPNNSCHTVKNDN